MQIKVQGTKPNTSLERKKNQKKNQEFMQPYRNATRLYQVAMRKLIQQITTRYM